MFEIFKAMASGKIKVGRKLYHLYDCSGKEVIEREFKAMTDLVWNDHPYLAVIIKQGNGWYALYTHPKHK